MGVHYNLTMTLILALETSTSTCSIALLSENAGVLALTQRVIEGASGHAENLLPLAHQVLDEAGLSKRDLDAVAFGQGPGAFTGLRVACGVAQGIGMALDIALIPVGALPALAAMAAARHPGRLMLPALDARMEEIYLGAYLDHPQRDLTVLQPPALLKATDAVEFVLQRLALWQRTTSVVTQPCLTGEGWRALHDAHALPNDWLIDDVHARPEAEWVARLAWQAWQQGRTILPEHAAPFYLRDKVAFTTVERSTGEGGNPRARQPSRSVLLPMTGADLPEVLELERAVQSFPWTAKNFEDTLTTGYEAWTLREQNRLVGFCVAMMAPDVAHILVIAVARNHQRAGYGRQLLEQVAQGARMRGAEGLLLEVRPSNTGALAFYAEQGFAQLGIRRDYYPAGRGQREDALVLKKTFSDA